MSRPAVTDRLHQLHLTAMAAAWTHPPQEPDVLALDCDDRFALLVDAEWTARHNRQIARRLREAHLRLPAAPEDLDWHTPRQLPKPLVQALVRSHWVADHQTVLVTGPTGVGKTLLLCALGTAACRHGYRVRYYRLPRLLGESRVAKQDGPWFAWLRQLSRWDLLLVDDWGFSALTPGASQDLFEILDDRYQRRATALASQVPVAQWHALLPDATVGEALLDRLVHQAHQISLRGESMRKVLSSPSGPSITEATEAPPPA